MLASLNTEAKADSPPGSVMSLDEVGVAYALDLVSLSRLLEMGKYGIMRSLQDMCF